MRAGGASNMRDLAQSAPGRWFTDSFIASSPDVVRRVQDGLENINPEGYAACCEALSTSDLRQDLHHIDTPMLFLAGLHDPVTTPVDAQKMQLEVRQSQLQTVNASHLSNIEAPQAFLHVLSGFLQQHTPPQISNQESPCSI